MTPIQLVVIDPEDTAALKQKEALRVPVICRYYTNAGEQVETEFRAAFASTRSNFLNAVELAFKTRELAAPAVATPKFHRVTISFQRQNQGFPLSTNLAAIWAVVESDREYQAALAARLREAMSHPIRAGALPQEAKPLSYNVRLVPMWDWNEPLSLEMADARGLSVRRTNLFTLKRARDRLQESFPSADLPLAKFLASFLKTNVIIDVELTRENRVRRTEPLWAADRYEAGQMLVKRGQTIDKKVKAALDLLREKTALGSLEQQLQADRLQARRRQARDRWMLAGSSALFLALLAGVWRLARPKKPVSLLPARVSYFDENGALVISCPTCSETIVVPNVGPEALPAPHVHERLLPHLVHMLKDAFVRKLITQRSDLLDMQQKAAADIAEMEERLAKIHAPLQERLRAYEQRISELEKELAQKGEENRELIKAKIQIAREHLAAAKDWVELN